MNPVLLWEGEGRYLESPKRFPNTVSVTRHCGIATGIGWTLLLLSFTSWMFSLLGWMMSKSYNKICPKCISTLEFKNSSTRNEQRNYNTKHTFLSNGLINIIKLSSKQLVLNLYLARSVFLVFQTWQRAHVHGSTCLLFSSYISWSN